MSSTHATARILGNYTLPDREPNASWALGRVCDRPGCDTILCRYNAGPSCWCCADEMKRAARARREESNLRIVPDPVGDPEVLRSWMRLMEEVRDAA